MVNPSEIVVEHSRLNGPGDDYECLTDLKSLVGRWPKLLVRGPTIGVSCVQPDQASPAAPIKPVRSTDVRWSYAY